MPALSLLREDKLSLLYSYTREVHEPYVTTEPYDRICRDIIWNDVRALDLLAKKASNLRAHCRRRGAKQCEQPITVRYRQHDRRPLLNTIALEVAHSGVCKQSLSEFAEAVDQKSWPFLFTPVVLDSLFASVLRTRERDMPACGKGSDGRHLTSDAASGYDRSDGEPE